MKPVLFSHYNCPHSLKVAFFLSLKGIDFERVEIDMRAGEQKTPEYLDINPKGTVPAYEDDNVRLGDSLDIMRYIDLQTGDPQLFPDDPETLDYVLSWVELGDNEFYDVSHQLYWQLLEPPEEGTDLEEVNRLKAKGMELLGELEAVLSRRQYICGDLTVADVALLPWLVSFERFDLPPEGYFPNVVDWREMLADLDDFKRNYRVKGIPFADYLRG